MEMTTAFLLGIFSILFLITPFAVNGFYQRRAARHADEMLAGNIVEFNGRIKANAVIVLVRRFLWAMFLWSGLIWNFREVRQRGFQVLTGLVLLAGFACAAYGVWGFRSELKRLKTVE